MMDPPPHKDPSTAAHGGETTFSVADFKADPGKVVAHAAATGCAVVIGASGRPCLVITIPIVDLPTLDY